MTDSIKTLRDSAAMRWIALLLLALAMFCSYIFMDILSPIKDLMMSERGWGQSRESEFLTVGSDTISR
jgi:hypothetical protein